MSFAGEAAHLETVFILFLPVLFLIGCDQRFFYSWGFKFLQVFYIVFLDDQQSKRGSWRLFWLGICVFGYVGPIYLQLKTDSDLVISHIQELKIQNLQLQNVFSSPLTLYWDIFIESSLPHLVFFFFFFRMQSAGIRTGTPHI